ncbi:MAG: glutamate--tRNA ligase [Candidatus Cloacimonadaceae bacterium]|nr:glutamate--tRNA ligase [Candidatus Cloacimonadaceae bacterium]MDP3115258.1 glutamate--tRNA ligase [Candidatus Cloacimonadaceae bacterium]
MKDIRVRFAPSPTGFLHIGGLRTALYDYLFARHTGGKFILRIEDTDRSRLVEGAVENLIDSLHKLGIDIDEGPDIGGDFGPYTQSERLELYHREAARLLQSGSAYHCFCSPETLEEMRAKQQTNKEFVKYDRRCLKLSTAEVQARLEAGIRSVLRLKMPDDHRFAFDDIIRGRVEMPASQSDDQVLLKSDGFPTYHLAAVVDDHYMQISHVIRGEEWLSSTPKHIWLYQCLGWEAPQWVHLPLILNPDRSKLSKRMNDVSVESYIQKGYLREALLNFVALMGWHASDDREIFSLEELCNEFTLERVAKSGAIFDITKLDWMNGQYLRSLPVEEIANRCSPYFESAGIIVENVALLEKIVAVARERCTLLPEIVEYSRMFLCPTDISDEDERLLQSEDAQRVISWFIENLPRNSPLNPEKIDILVKNAMSELGIKGKAFFTPLRLALINQAHGPELPSTFSILGEKEAMRRLKHRLI